MIEKVNRKKFKKEIKLRNSYMFIYTKNLIKMLMFKILEENSEL